MKKILLIVLVGTFFAAGAAYAGCGTCGPKDGADKVKCAENCAKACCAEKAECDDAKKCAEGCDKKCCAEKAKKCGDDCKKPCCAKDDATASAKEAVPPCCAKMLGDPA